MAKDKIILSEMDANFKNEIASMPGAEHFQRCFTCGTCTAACPVAEVHEDYDPRRIIRMCILGMKKEFIIELDSTLTEAFNKGLVDEKIGKEKTLDIGFAAFFYDKLVREKKDPAYYGDSATLNDPNSVLVRWKLSKNKYRVIYTSLKAETVTAEKLAELERQLPQ